MADSDDDFDRRGNSRDKFRQERHDYERRDDRRNREQWEDGAGWVRKDRREGYRDIDRGRRYSPQRPDGNSPPQMKRMRRDWDDGGYQHYDPAPYGGLPHPPPPSSWGPPDLPPPPHGPAAAGPRSSESDFPTQPQIKTFKHFLATQDDNITDEEAIKRYNEYKLDFKKQQINEFFIQHKDEDWFRCKYHPDEYSKRLTENEAILKNRCDVFMKLFDLNRIETVSLDADKTAELIKLLDAAVILLEGGSEFDLKCLDEPAKSDAKSKAAVNRQSTESQSAKEKDDMSGDSNGEEDDKKDNPDNEENDEVSHKMNHKQTAGEDNIHDEELKEANKKMTGKKHREKSTFSESDSETGSLSESDESNAGQADEPPRPAMDEVKSEDEAEKDQDTAEEGEDRDEPKPQAYHRTQSIFLRNIAPNITKQEVEAVCKRYPGYLRVSLQDPQPERHFLRRGWVTFDRTVNIKEICYNLNNIRLRESELGAIVNRELKLRVRPVSSVTMHRAVAKQDIKHAAKIIQSLDNRWNMWKEKKEDDKDIENFGFVSNNPLLKNITDFLVDEGSYEEEALLGQDVDQPKESGSELSIDRDEALLKVLDKMLLYLRLVYSFDYYSAVEYPNEDEMPHRCGIIHARGSLPATKFTQSDVSEWLNSFEIRITPFINMKLALDDAEAVRLGKKNTDEEVEKFITANTQELAKDKWLCPLSGKKFKGPEFVRKHILNKNADKLEEVKKQVEYFNTFLMDPRRPQLPDHPTTRGQGAAPRGEGYGPPSGGYHGPPHNMMGYNPRPMMHYGRRGYRRGYGGMNFQHRGTDFRRDRYPPRRDRGRPDPRGIIEYRDLDAPADMDSF